MVCTHSEGAPSRRLPGILLIIIVLCDNHHLLCHQVGRIKANAKLSNHGDVCTSLPKSFKVKHTDTHRTTANQKIPTLMKGACLAKIPHT